jgi:hypothetical protein
VCVPDAQAAHWRFAVELPGLLTYEPAAQSLHGTQLDAFEVVL